MKKSRLTTAVTIGLSGQAQAGNWDVHMDIDPITDEKTVWVTGTVKDGYEYHGLTWGCLVEGEGIIIDDNTIRGSGSVDVTFRFDSGEPMSARFIVRDSILGLPYPHANFMTIIEGIRDARERIVVRTDEETFIIPAAGSTAAVNKALGVCEGLRAKRGE